MFINSYLSIYYRLIGLYNTNRFVSGSKGFLVAYKPAWRAFGQLLGRVVLIHTFWFLSKLIC